MPNATPLTDAINALTTYANETTGASDTTLSDAVGTLVAGYGSGSSVSISDIASGSYPSGAFDITGITSFVDYAFSGRNRITSVTGTGIYMTGSYVFRECKRITSANLTCSRISGTNIFYGCTALLTAVVSIANNTSNSLFNECSNMTIADMTVSNIRAATFNQCKALATLILRSNSVVTLANVSAFTNTPIYGYNSLTGTIYVPSNLISSYQSATNWSKIYSAGYVTFAAIEGSQYETQYADGTPIS